MKVLFVTIGFLPAVAWGGPVKIVYQNALELQRRGHKIAVCASNLLDKKTRIAPGSFERNIDGIRVIYLNTYRFKRWPGTLGPTFLAPEALRRLWNEVSRAEVVHVNGTRNIIAMMVIVFASWQRKPIVMQPHGTLPPIVNSIRFKQLFDGLFLKRLVDNVNCFIAGQKAEEQQIIKAGGKPNWIRIVANGLDTSNYANTTYRNKFRHRFGIPPTCQVILFLARINRKKGTDLLVEAFARLPEGTRRQTRLVIAGPDDGQLAEVQALVERYRLGEQVIFTGLLSGEMVSAAHADADLFVLPCRVDTFPMAILEACQAGTPMVVTETCEIADMLDRQVATIVPVDPARIATAMAELLQDAGLRQRYRQGAQQLMRTVFSIEAVGEQLEAVYMRAIEACQPD
jgi:glycosyltransferase involved in cell wall biosynthesis